MKLDHIKIKPTMVNIHDMNNDAPINGELFAEAMHALFRLAKGTEPIPFWTDKAACIKYERDAIKSLLAPKAHATPLYIR